MIGNYQVQNKTHTQELAKKFASHIYAKKHALILLSAPVGAGKTVFVASALQTLGVKSHYITSPSYTLLNEYRTENINIYHVDLYRVEKHAVTAVLDSLEILEKTETAIVFIEWAQKIDEKYFSDLHYHVYIDIIDEHKRNIQITQNS